MIFNNNFGYYHALDRTDEIDNAIDEPIILRDEQKSMNLNLGPQEIGTSLNPFQHQLHALSAKIKEGASKVEFEFFGAGKGQKERATPESFDKEERLEMRQLAEINEVRSSTHATVAVSGLAGFDAQRGFEEQNRDKTLREVEKAIDFAGDASTGGAVVVHTGEWNRPIYDSHKQEGFVGYEGEAKRAPIMVVDGRTGELRAMRKDSPIYEPKFKTVAEYEEEIGKKLVGTTDSKGDLYEEMDWISVNGDVIKRDWEFDLEKSSLMFERVPEWNKEMTMFETEKRDWKHFENKARVWNERHPNQLLTPEEIFAKTQYMNQALQARGSSLYHGKYYNHEKEIRDEVKKALDFYERLEESLPEEEKEKLVIQKTFDYQASSIIPPKDVPIKEYLLEKLKIQEDSMRYTHEASAAADVQAKQAEDAMKNVQTMEEYGLDRSTESLATLGIKTWQKYEANKEHLKEKLYIAPENWHPEQYGSHPDELLKIVRGARQKMIAKLTPSLGQEKAKELAYDHIKTTLDTGHLNLWKKHLQRKTDEHGLVIESDEAFDKRFADWALGKVKKMHEEKALGHVHLTDNFGYDDEHISLGKGNAPVREITKFMAEKGYKDFIAEPGSFNPQSILPEAWSLFGSPVYSIGTGVTPSHPGRFSGVYQRQFGYNAPPMYIVGAYVPSNEWKLWSEVPLE